MIRFTSVEEAGTCQKCGFCILPEELPLKHGVGARRLTLNHEVRRD